MSADKVFLITVDGPSASGKSSLSRSLAEKLSWKWLSTGVFYRGLAYLALLRKVKTEKDTANLINTEDWRILLSDECTRFLHKGQDITKFVYTEEVDDTASRLAKFSLIRKALLPHQRKCFAQNRPGLVAEGRDCGTVVFPFAGLKIYLTAEDSIRALRRADQRGSLPVDDVRALQKKRDTQDSRRADSPLRRAKGAFIIDTGACGFQEMVEKAYKKSRRLFYQTP